MSKYISVGEIFLYELTTAIALLKGYFKVPAASKTMHFDCYICTTLIIENIFSVVLYS